MENGEKIDLTYIPFDQKRLQQILSAFKKSQSLALSPVHKMLGEDFSYDELRIARILGKLIKQTP